MPLEIGHATDDDPHARNNEGAVAMKAFFTGERLTSLPASLRRFMSLTSIDLAAWQEDPEEYVNAQASKHGF